MHFYTQTHTYMQCSCIQNALEPKRLATNWCMLSAHILTLANT